MLGRLAALTTLAVLAAIGSAAFAPSSPDRQVVAFDTTGDSDQSIYIVFDDGVARGQISEDRVIAEWVMSSVSGISSTTDFRPGELDQSWTFNMRGPISGFGISGAASRRLRCRIEVDLWRGSRAGAGAPNTLVVARVAARRCRYSNGLDGETAYNIAMGGADVKTVLTVVSSRASKKYGGAREHGLPESFRVRRALPAQENKS